MKTMKRTILVMALVATVGLLQGCTNFWSLILEPVPPKTIPTYITENDDKSAQKVIGDYFEALYKEAPETTMEKALEGEVPSGIKSYLTKETLDLSEGNPEMPIHLPRFVELNKKTITNYSVIQRDGAKVESKLVEKLDEPDSYLYYTMVNLSCECLTNSEFEERYEYDEEIGIYEPKDDAEIDEEAEDQMKVKAKYDVVVKKEGSSFKIVSAKEINDMLQFKRRIHKQNNEFLQRIPWLEIDGADKSVYQKEKQIVEKLMEELLELTAADIGLLRTGWDEDVEKFEEVLERLNVTSAKMFMLEEKEEEQTTQGSEEVEGEATTTGDDEEVVSPYKYNFPINELPVHKDIEKIMPNSVDILLVEPNVSYTPKNIEYLIQIQATARMKNNIPSTGKDLRYDYIISLDNEEGYKIKSYRLEDVYETQVRKKEQSSEEEGKEESEESK